MKLMYIQLKFALLIYYLIILIKYGKVILNKKLINIDAEFVKGLKIIDKIQERSDLSSLEDELYGSYDPYQYLRDSYIQNRTYKLNNGVVDEEDEFDEIDFEDF